MGVNEREARVDGGGLREEPVAAVERRDGAIVVRLTGELDLYNADTLRAALFDAAAETPERLVVDLAEVRFIDSTALGVLVETRSRVSAFLLAAPALETRRALQVSGLDRHFAVHGTVEDALAATP
jgi:anti-sigma B factor antagonist